MYTVKQVSEIMGISPYTLRFYDNEGLFPNLKRGANGRRYFSREDLNWVHVVQCFRNTGLSIEEIRKYVEAACRGDDTLQERFELVQRQRVKVMKDLEVIKKQLATLDRKTEYYKALMRGDDVSPFLPDIDAMIAEAEKKSALSQNTGRKPEKAKTAA